VVPEIEAIATEILLEIEAVGLAEVIPTARAVNLTMNREGIRRLAAETLETADFALRICRHPCRNDRRCRPARLPGDRQAGDVVVRQGSVEGRRRQPAAGGLGPMPPAGGRVDKGRVIVEGVIDFDYEITLLTVRASSDASGEIETHFCEPIGHVQVNGDYVESWQPQAMSAAALACAQEIAAAVTGNLGGRGLFGVELFVKGDTVWFSEVSPRPHDTGMVTLATQRQNEFELHARAILGLPVDVIAARTRRFGGDLRRHGGRRDRFDGVADALRTPGVDLRLFGKPQAFVRRRMGVALATAASTDEARLRAKARRQWSNR
jgi:phosphoribosylglycinamide formyltransferase 2